LICSLFLYKFFVANKLETYPFFFF